MMLRIVAFALVFVAGGVSLAEAAGVGDGLMPGGVDRALQERFAVPAVVGPRRAVAGLPAEWAAKRRPAGQAWLNADQPGLAFSVTDRFSLALRYRHVDAEDLVAVPTATAGYDSHDFLVRGHWRF